MKNSSALKAFTALAHETRLAIFKTLTQKGANGMQAGEISKLFNIAGATLNFHLNQLVTAKLIESRKEGRAVYYSVKFKRIKKLTNYLTDNYYNNKNIDDSGNIKETESTDIVETKPLD